MNSLWTVLLHKAIAALIGYNWGLVKSTVADLLNKDISGAEKRQLAYEMLRMAGVDGATWLVYAAIEIAYGAIKK